MHLVKAHAYGNDFLYVDADEAERSGRLPADLARRLCARHTGVGADGLILYREKADEVTMRLLNADGSPSEVSGNGVRGLAAIVARAGHLSPDERDVTIKIRTDAGVKYLSLTDRDGDSRFQFRAEMGPPEGVRRVRLDVAGETVDAAALSIGNPQCVVLGPLDQERLGRLGPALQHHPEFPHGVNLEIANIEAPDRVRILIWERGVGPTQSSGTGSCAAAVVAAAFGGAARDVEVIAPGGGQRVQWTDNTLVLTGWAEIVLEGTWIA
jgi:diaminopimelate epimerase